MAAYADCHVGDWHEARLRRVASSRSAVFALCLGNAVQWYDFALYGAFASIIGPVFFRLEDPSTVMLAAFATYGIALIVRPLGALLFGRMGDLRGRRAVLVPIILIMAGASAVAFLPGYAVIGILAPVTLIMLRTAQGLAAGGELGVAEVLIFERGTQWPAGPSELLAYRHPGNRPRPWHGRCLPFARDRARRSIGYCLVAAGFSAGAALGTGWRVCSPQGQRDNPVPRCFASRSDHQATHPSPLA